jgi:uncharacterized protein YcbX
MTASIQTLTHFPIKGLSGHDLSEVPLKPNEGFPLDRVFGFARPNSGFDPANPVPLPKDKFHVLAGDARLALLDTSYDEATQTLTIKGDAKSASFVISDGAGCADASAYLRDYLAIDEADTPTLFAAHPHRFTDVSVTSAQMMNAISLVNRNSVDAFAAEVDAPVEAARFRANIVFDGMEAYAELDLLDRTVQIGDAQLRVLKRTKRCAATEVNLATGERDLKVPYLLRKHLGHMDMGIYAEVVTGGVIRPGDTLRVLA